MKIKKITITNLKKLLLLQQVLDTSGKIGSFYYFERFGYKPDEVRELNEDELENFIKTYYLIFDEQCTLWPTFIHEYNLWPMFIYACTTKTTEQPINYL